jgi:fatty acid synthase
MEIGKIPANLHFKSPNPNIKALVDGRMKVVAENFDWAGGYAAINSFGFGGANTHCLLRSMPKEPKESKEPGTAGKSQNSISLICYSGRTEDGLKSTFDQLKKNSDDFGVELILANQCGTKTNLNPYRGYMVVGTQETPLIEIQV